MRIASTRALIGATVASVTLAFGAMPAAAPAKSKTKKHCVKYKTVKSKKGKSIKRCAKYSK